MTTSVSPRLRALLVGEDPMLRYLVRESLENEGIAMAQEVGRPQEISPRSRHDLQDGVVILCLSGPREVWNRTIADTRRTLPGGRVVAVTFGGPGAPAAVADTPDANLGADGMVQAPLQPGALREAVSHARTPHRSD